MGRISVSRGAIPFRWYHSPETGGIHPFRAIGEKGIETRAIVETLARGLKIPAVSIPQSEAADHFGGMAMFAGIDMAASSALTQAKLGWRRTGSELIADLEAMRYA